MCTHSGRKEKEDVCAVYGNAIIGNASKIIWNRFKRRVLG
jgi:hypothetical protein